MFNLDPADAALDELLKVRAEICLIVTRWPGQVGSEPYPAPKHIKEQMLVGLSFPYIREATQKELEHYGMKHKLFSAELVKQITKA